ncbi:unnamed protein product [Rotaria magnacalcarata]|uniref:Uncharacterized protein n=1 Tax=Rotaria magnacalcarata TaxID=392030 RepID=A0A816CCV9_9BILA|nr:unnamed protein product [Rotaria magnacalcarata]
MDISCLNIFPPLPTVPVLANDSNHLVHSTYNPNSGSISSRISAAMARSTFSNQNVQSLLQRLFNNNSKSWSVSEITKTKPIPSVIAYASVALGLFLMFSITFCTLSCCKLKNNQNQKRRHSKSSRICLFLLIVVYLLGIADMIYVAHRVNTSKTSIDNGIKQLNRDIYPNEIAQHIRYLNQQLGNLDQYFLQPNSILINASKSMLINAFDEVLNGKYYLNDTAQHVNNIDRNVQKLKIIVKDDLSLPTLVVQIINNVAEQYENTIVFLQKPLQEICNYTSGTDADIDREISSALYTVHRTLSKIIDTVNNDILPTMTPWESHMLINQKLEEDIRGYFNLVGTIAVVFVILLGVIPLGFFIVIIISCLCTGSDHGSRGNQNRMPMENMSKELYAHSINGSSKNSSTHQHRTANKMRHSYRNESEYMESDNGSSGVLFCFIRIAFIIMIIMLITMVLLTGVYYALDLAVQGACRTVHDDQPWLINFAIDNLVGLNNLFVDRAEMNRTTYNVINDCRDNVHFTRKMFDEYLSILDTDVENVMNKMSEKIHDQFVQSIGDIDIPADIATVVNLITEANQTNITSIAVEIQADLLAINQVFNNISNSSSTLSKNFTQSTIKKVENYVKSVLESTVDGCPLPLSTIYKADTLVCHNLSSSLNGLWLSICFFMFLVICGFCIFGLSVYRQSN